MKKRTKIIIGAVMALLALATLMVVIIMTDKNVMEMGFTKEITVVNHVPSEEQSEYEIEISKDGGYTFHAVWEENSLGLTTGIEIFDEEGEQVFKATANGCDMYSGALELKKGTYTMVLTYITSNDQWVTYFENDNMEDWDEKPNFENEHVNVPDGTVLIDYKFELEREIPILGYAFVAGMLAGLIFVVILVTAATKGDEVKARYDERQELVRGKGFKYAFFSMITWAVILFALEPLEITLPLSTSNASFINVIFGVTVYATYCIWNDGYFALNQKSGLIMTVLIIMGVINLLMGINAFVEGYAWINGQLSIRSMNLFCGIVMIIVCTTMLLKKFVKDRKEE